MRRKIGFIGLGDQGAPMAQGLASSHDLRIWARREASYEPFPLVQGADFPEKIKSYASQNLLGRDLRPPVLGLGRQRTFLYSPSIKEALLAGDSP